MDTAISKKNQDIYELVKANLLQSTKGLIFLDNPRYVVHKVDQLFSQNHNLPTRDFLRVLGFRLKEMKQDFPSDVEEFRRLREVLDALEKYFLKKCEQEDL